MFDMHLICRLNESIHSELYFGTLFEVYQVHETEPASHIARDVARDVQLLCTVLGLLVK